ncbi:MAG: hypothetical protein GY868_19475, partial [Deltaproteobacteria bacterium]|nr:hypothetical protein [Deltaproteobacteria bacterium]
MKNLYLIMIIICMPAIPVSKSLGAAYWANSYSVGSYSAATAIDNTADGGFVTAGVNRSSGNYDISVMKLNSAGTVEWEHGYGSSGEDFPYEICETADGGAIIAGSSYFAGRDMWLLKLSAAGEVEWQSSYGGSRDDHAYAARQTTDGGYIVAGSTYAFESGIRDGLVFKLDDTGELEWQKNYSGSGDELFYAVSQTADGGYILTGYTNSYGQGSTDALVVKIGGSGTVEWQKTYGRKQMDAALDIVPTADGGYALAGLISSNGNGKPDGLILKLDEDGGIVERQVYGGNANEQFFSIDHAADGGYVAAGYTNSFGSGNTDMWFVKTDAGLNVDWEYTYGSTQADVSFFIRQAAETGYVAAGLASSDTVNTSNSPLWYNFHGSRGQTWILKIDEDGMIDECPYMRTANSEREDEEAIKVMDAGLTESAADIQAYETLFTLQQHSAIVSPICNSCDTEECGDGGTQDNTTENSPPVAAFTLSSVTVAVSKTFELDASDSYDAEDDDATLSVRWDYESDGSWDTQYTTDKNTDHNYPAEGSYTITLEVKDSGGLTATATREVTVSGASGPACSA